MLATDVVSGNLVYKWITLEISVFHSWKIRVILYEAASQNKSHIVKIAEQMLSLHGLHVLIN